MNRKVEATSSTGSASDPIQINYDWHYQLDQTVLFVFWLERQGRKSRVEALVNPSAFDLNEAQRLNEVMRRWPHQTSAIERVRTMAWLIGVSLKQQRPESPQEERDAEVRRLLLFEDTLQPQDNTDAEAPLSARESYFEWQGQNFLIRTKQAELFELAKQLPHYEEIQQRWWKLLPVLDFGLPRLSTDLESQQAEGFFLELRHGDRSRVFSQYASLIQGHADDERFWSLVASVLESRFSAPDAGLSLPYHLACGWIHGFLWGLSNPDRELALSRFYGVKLRKLTPEAIKKAVQRIGWLDWTDFPDAYSVAPIKVIFERDLDDQTQKTCQFEINWQGQT
jgi:hypothetical protein